MSFYHKYLFDFNNNSQKYFSIMLLTANTICAILLIFGIQYIDEKGRIQ